MREVCAISLHHEGCNLFINFLLTFSPIRRKTEPHMWTVKAAFCDTLTLFLGGNLMCL